MLPLGCNKEPFQMLVLSIFCDMPCRLRRLKICCLDSAVWLGKLYLANGWQSGATEMLRSRTDDDGNDLDTMRTSCGMIWIGLLASTQPALAVIMWSPESLCLPTWGDWLQLVDRGHHAQTLCLPTWGEWIPLVDRAIIQWPPVDPHQVADHNW